jgi:hypothetical protein
LFRDEVLCSSERLERETIGRLRDIKGMEALTKILVRSYEKEGYYLTAIRYSENYEPEAKALGYKYEGIDMKCDLGMPAGQIRMDHRMNGF